MKTLLITLILFSISQGAWAADKNKQKVCKEFEWQRDSLLKKGNKYQSYKFLKTIKTVEDQKQALAEIEKIRQELSLLHINPKYKDCSGSLSQMLPENEEE